MKTGKKNITRKKTTAPAIEQAIKKPFNSTPYLIAGTPLMLVSMSYIAHRLFLFEQTWIVIAQLSVFAGILFENTRISEKRIDVLKTLLGVFFATLIFLIFFVVYLMFSTTPIEQFNINELYARDEHLTFFVYVFLCSYLIISWLINEIKVTRKLTEGITVFQSLALIYWVLDIGFINIKDNQTQILIGIGLCFSVFSLIHALSLIKLSNMHRFILSIWSSVVMLIFSAEYVHNIFSENHEWVSLNNHRGLLYETLQYFLLGVSSMYIIQNIAMLWGFVPEKHGDYIKQVNALATKHVNRYSDSQVSRLEALFCVIFASSFFMFNYYFHYLSRNVAIWSAFVVFPLILNTYYRFKNKLLISKITL